MKVDTIAYHYSFNCRKVRHTLNSNVRFFAGRIIPDNFNVIPFCLIGSLSYKYATQS